MQWFLDLFLPVIVAATAFLLLSRVGSFRALGTMHKGIVGAGIGALVLLAFLYAQHLVS